MLTVTFAELESALATGKATLDAGEAHGVLCGGLAAVNGYSAAAWLREPVAAAGGGAVALRARDLLETLYAETAAALVGQDLDFTPLLPDDEQPLAQRVGALGEWCAGFLYGVGTGVPAGTVLSAAAEEVLHDFGEIRRAIVDGGESEESNEGAYAELVEYLRAGAQLVYDELGAWRAGPDAA